ncbi:YhbY family RNA-binding protein [Salinisphaera aquimarina]|uniref:YhbY family RNA-binding protein n=1 Tax=Salinisphaera aquimarina TaxID=2094031 RepID=A0ABV7ESM5_9GAMM
MSLTLDTEARRALKKQAHHLKPIVQSGAAGLSEAVLAEIERALVDHELVKIKLAADDKSAFQADVDTACETLRAACVQQIGRTATLYRPKPDKQKTEKSGNKKKKK